MPTQTALQPPASPIDPDVARGEIETVIGRRTAVVLTAAFLLLVGFVTVYQTTLDLRRGPRHWKGLVSQRPTAERLSEFERSLERDAVLRAAVQPVAQRGLVRWLGQGTNEVIVERLDAPSNARLLYRPAVRHVTGRGFLEPESIAHRERAAIERDGREIHADPIPAILQFNRELAKRNIKLILLPIPDKFVGGAWPDAHNPSLVEFRARVNRAGIVVFDATPPVPGDQSSLLLDTHWAPGQMERVASGLAYQMRDLLRWPDISNPAYRSDGELVTNRGDLFELLGLPPNQTLFAPQMVSIRRIRRPDGTDWQPNPQSDILLLGDSFTNIYSDPRMGWGASAGLAELLSFMLRRDIDVIALNDHGAYASREALSRELARGRDRLAGKRVVIWEFAERELSVGDWRPTPLVLGKSSPPQFLAPPRGQEMTISGTVRQRSGVDLSSKSPYADQVMAVHLVDVEGGGVSPGSESVVYLLAVRQRAATPAASVRPGDQIRVRLRNWTDVSKEFSRIRRTELTEESLQLADPAWGEVIPPAQ